MISTAGTSSVARKAKASAMKPSNWTREYVRLSKKFTGTNGKNLYGDAKKEFEYYEKIKEAYEEARGKAEGMKAQIDGQFVKIEEAFATISKATGKQMFTTDDLAKMDAV